MATVTASPVAMEAICASSMAVAKYATSAAGLNPADYNDMTEVAASQTAMAAVAASQTAMAAVAASQTAMTAVIDSPTALSAVVSSQTAMTAVAGSSTAMAAVAASTTAVNALKSSPLLTSKKKGGNSWSEDTVRNGKGIAVYIFGASVSGGDGWVKTDGVQTSFRSNNTNQNIVKAFQSSLTVRWYQSGSVLYYIPC